jgi:hypothetical protein
MSETRRPPDPDHRVTQESNAEIVIDPDEDADGAVQDARRHPASPGTGGADEPTPDSGPS